MWKVELEREFLKLEFKFKDIEEVSCFVEAAIKGNRSVKAIVTLESEHKEVEAGEENEV